MNSTVRGGGDTARTSSLDEENREEASTAPAPRGNPGTLLALHHSLQPTEGEVSSSDDGPPIPPAQLQANAFAEEKLRTASIDGENKAIRAAARRLVERVDQRSVGFRKYLRESLTWYSMASAAAEVAQSYENEKRSSIGSAGSDPYGPARSGDESDSDATAEVGEEKPAAVGTAGKTQSSRLSCRRALLAIASVAIVAGASAGIGFVVTGGDSTNEKSADAAAAPDRQRLLEIAEEVVEACDDDKQKEGLADCQRLCQGHTCCFEEGESSCKDDAEKDCPVYAGCKALNLRNSFLGSGIDLPRLDPYNL